MDIKEIQQLKIEHTFRIMDEMNSFERQTGCKITDVQISRVDGNNKCSGGVRISFISNLELVVEV